MTVPTIAARHAHAILDAAAYAGLDTTALLDAAGIDRLSIGGADARIPLAAQTRLWREAVRLTGADDDALVLDRALLDQPLRNADAELAEALDRFASQQLAKVPPVDDQVLEPRVSAWLRQAVVSGTPGMSDAALLAGFAAKRAFYCAFRRWTGGTPAASRDASGQFDRWGRRRRLRRAQRTPARTAAAVTENF